MQDRFSWYWTPSVSTIAPASNGDALLAERELGEVIPMLVELLRHRLLVGAVQSRDLGGLFVAGSGRDPLEELVRRDLHVLGRIAVACVPAGLLAADHVER